MWKPKNDCNRRGVFPEQYGIWKLIILNNIVNYLLESFLNVICYQLGRHDIVEGEHARWDDVSGPYRETIRAFLVHFQYQVILLHFFIMCICMHPLECLRTISFTNLYSSRH